MTASFVIQASSHHRSSQRTVEVAAPGRAGQLSAETADQLARALGQAVARCWGTLAQDAQQDLFEAAVAAEGEAIRQRLAIFLHGKHARTISALHAAATPEPDSLGG